MLIGYARTSTADQKAGLEAQTTELRTTGCEELFVEQVSSVQRREELEKALKFVRKGDTLVVTKLDRLARSIPDWVRIIGTVEEKQATLRILAMNLDTNTPTGRLLLNLVGSVAQFEREIMLERQREGVARAKTEGKYKGRKPTARGRKSEDRDRQVPKADHRPSDIAKAVGIGRASVYRILTGGRFSLSLRGWRPTKSCKNTRLAICRGCKTHSKTDPFRKNFSQRISCNAIALNWARSEMLSAPAPAA